MVLSPENTISDVGDPVHLAYILAWNAHQLFRDPLHLFDSNSFYPWPMSLAFSDHLVPESILVAPVQWFTGNPILAYNAAVFLGLFLSAVFMRSLVLEATGHRGAALVSGIVYAFNGFTLVEANRVHVIHLQWWPLALLFLGRFVSGPTFGRAMVLSAALALQGLSGSYYLAFTALVAPVWLLLAYVASASRPTVRAVVRLAIAAAIAAIPVAFLIWPYFARGLPKSRVSDGVDLLGYLSPAAGSMLWRNWLPLDPVGREFKGILGLALILAGVIAVIRSHPSWFKALGAIACATAFIGVTLSMGDRMSVAGISFGYGPHHLLQTLLPLEGLRHTPRFNALAVLGCAILAGLGFSRWIGSSWRGTVATIIVCALLPLEHWSATGYGMRTPDSAALRTAYANLPVGPVVDLPLYPLTRRRYWAAYPYLSTYHWNPVPIGRTSFYPPGHEYLAWLLSFFPDPISVSVLSRLGVTTAVVHPRVWPVEERAIRLAQVLETDGLSRIDRESPVFNENAFDLGGEAYFAISRPSDSARPCSPQAEIAASALTVFPMGDTPEAGLSSVLDRELRTGWSSGPDQSGWYGFQVQLKPAQELAAVSIETPHDRFPRVWPSLEIRVPGGQWQSVAAPPTAAAAWETLEDQLNGGRTLRSILRFDRREVRAFRLVYPSHAKPPTQNFEIMEIRAFGACS
jgi:hypothetical protein